MVLEGDFYLPGKISPTADGPVLKHDTGTVPVVDSAGLLDVDLNERPYTVGLIAENWSSKPAAADASVGIESANDGVTLIGSQTYLQISPEPRSSHGFIRLAFAPGVWPGAPGRHEDAAPSRYRGRARNQPFPDPIRTCEGQPQRVRIDADSLVVVDVLEGAANPYGNPLEDFRIEFGSDRQWSRLTVPGVPIWNSNGWWNRDAGSVCSLFGKRLRAALEGVENPRVSMANPFDMTIEGDTIRLQWLYLTHKLGVWPVDGLRFDRASFVRSWLRDAKLIHQSVGSEDLDSLAKEVQDLANVEPAPDRRFLTSGDAFESDELLGALQENSQDRRDAMVTLWQRDESLPAAAITELPMAEYTPADRWLLTGLLADRGGPEAVATLLQLIRTAETENVRNRAARLLSKRIRCSDSPQIYAERHDRGWRSDGPPARRYAREAASILFDNAEPTVQDLVTACETEEVPQIRPVAVDAFATTEGPAVVPELLDSLVEQESERIRKHIATAIEIVDADLVGLANVHEIASASRGPKQRQSLLRRSDYGEYSARDAVVSALESDDLGVWPMGVDRATEFTDNPPYEELIDLLVRVDPLKGPRLQSKAWDEALDGLAKLIRDEDAPDPPTDPLLDLLSQGDRAREIAFEGLDE